MTLNQAWIHILDCLGTGTAYLMFAIIFIMARSKKGVGYQRFLFMATIFCIASAFAAYAAAWDLYYGTNIMVLYVSTPTVIIKFVFAVYCWHNFSNFVRTLRRSEYVDKLQQDAMCDRMQRRWNLLTVMEIMRERVHEWHERRGPYESAVSAANAAVGDLSK